MYLDPHGQGKAYDFPLKLKAYLEKANTSTFSFSTGLFNRTKHLWKRLVTEVCFKAGLQRIYDSGWVVRCVFDLKQKCLVRCRRDLLVRERRKGGGRDGCPALATF